MATATKKVIKISPELDKAGSEKLNRDVKKVFTSSSFTNALSSGFKAAGLAFAAAVGVGKIIDSANTIRDDVLSNIRGKLSRMDETNTRAGFYGAAPERLARLEDIAAATGVQQAELYNAIDRFGNYIREAKKNGLTGADTYSDNTFEAFLQFMGALEKAAPEIRNAEMYKALGRTSGKFAEFVSADWGAIEGRLGPALSRKEIRDMADLADELDLQEVKYRRAGDKELADHLSMRNYAIERNLITNIQNNFDTEVRGITTTWAREIKRTVSTMQALRESIEAVKSVVDTLSTTPEAPEQHRPKQESWVGGMSYAPKDNSGQILMSKATNQNKKGINE